MSDEHERCIHCYISGRVQGVWFRASTKEEADKLNLKGWVRNLSDGRVELIACGDQEKIKQLRAWLEHGPERAEVSHIEEEEMPLQAFDGFKTL